MIEETPVSQTPSDERPLIVEAVQVTDVGLVRSENQDFAVLGPAELNLSTAGRGRLMVVADGMGGHRGGATASKLAANTIRADYMESEETDPAVGLRTAMEKANLLIFQEAQINPDLRGMGTTCSALVIQGRRGYFTHVGDSRIYRVREDGISQLTEDHSLVASMVREGLLTSQEAEVHPRRNVLQRSMGVGEVVEIDVSGPFEVGTGDTFILCSDGLHGLVKADEMRVIAAKPVEEAAREFVRLAIERGAPDNVTVIVARAKEISGEAPPPEPVKQAPVSDSRPESEVTTSRFPVVSETETQKPVAEAAPPPAPEATPKPEATKGGAPWYLWLIVLILIAIVAFLFRDSF